jgi:hypothetical protein
MRLVAAVQAILDNALAGKAPDKRQYARLLECAPESLEGATIRAAGDHATRKRFGNQAILLGQIGVEAAPLASQTVFNVGADEALREWLDLMPDNRVFLVFPGEGLFQFHVALRIE